MSLMQYYEILVVSDHALVPVQNYITAIIIFLVVEMLMTWGYYGKLVPFVYSHRVANRCRL